MTVINKNEYEISTSENAKFLFSLESTGNEVAERQKRYIFSLDLLIK